MSKKMTEMLKAIAPALEHLDDEMPEVKDWSKAERGRFHREGSPLLYMLTRKRYVDASFEVIYVWSSNRVPELAALRKRLPELFVKPGRYSIWSAREGIDVQEEKGER